MKIKCKQCHKKFKDHKQVECDQPTCSIKYGIQGDAWNFDAIDKVNPCEEKIEIIEHFESPAPAPVMTTEEWVKYCEENPDVGCGY